MAAYRAPARYGKVSCRESAQRRPRSPGCRSGALPGVQKNSQLSEQGVRLLTLSPGREAANGPRAGRGGEVPPGTYATCIGARDGCEASLKPEGEMRTIP